MKVLNFGSCNVDYVYSVDHIIKAGETLSARSVDVFPGGKGLNQSVALLKAGIHVYHAGIIGEDGAFLKEMLESDGADTTYLKTEKGKSGHAIIQVDSSGENCICVFEGTNGNVTVDFADEVLRAFGKGDIILIQNEISYTDYILAQAARRGMTVVLNPSPMNEKIKAIDISRVGYLILNETEAREISGTPTAREFIAYMREKYPSVKVVLTLGKRGCIYFSDSEIIEHPAFSVNAVDTTSAGDTFTGYFVSLISQGRSPRDAIRYASAASAITVSRPGASVSIPYLTEVEELLPTLAVSSTQSSDRKESLLNQINEYISSAPDKATLRGLADRIGYSKSYAGVIVKELTGGSFTCAVQTARCRAAAELLERGESIGTVIKKVGYENESFFRKKFMQIYGRSPREYKKELSSK